MGKVESRKKEDISAVTEDKLKAALLKRAIGGNVEEVTEEYVSAGANDALKLIKRKVSTKYNQPDVAAVKALLALDAGEMSDMTDAELVAERERILDCLRQNDEPTAVKSEE